MPKGKTLVVARNHPKASDKNSGTERVPFKTINRAAAIAQPGDTVLIHQGVYRERVDPARGGTARQPISYIGAPGEKVYIRGSDVLRSQWRAMKGYRNVYRASLAQIQFGTKCYHGHVDKKMYGDFNPFRYNFNRSQYKAVRPVAQVEQVLRDRIKELKKKLRTAEGTGEGQVGRKEHIFRQIAVMEQQLKSIRSKKNPRYPTTMAMVFVDGKPLVEVETMDELASMSATWMTSGNGDELLLHFPPSDIPIDNHLVEITTRHTVFSPRQRGLGYIHVKNLIVEHGANPLLSWGTHGWPQIGLLSCRSGHHWVIEKNIIRYAKGIGIDIGQEHIDSVNIEPSPMPDVRYSASNYEEFRKRNPAIVGHHSVLDNLICDNGLCGLTGIFHYRTKIIGNRIERNNRSGYVSPYWEFGGIKFHQFYDGIIEGNLIRDNDSHGIWIDNQWRGSRITRNVIVNNLWSGINVELGRGPVLIDNNVIAYTRQGDGIYGHDMSDVAIAHNLLYANANFGVWMAYATPRIKKEDGCWDNKVFNNMILGNKAGAISWPMPFSAGGRNKSDSNLLMGGGEYCDEGSGPKEPLFEINNAAHMAKMQKFIDFPAQTPDVVARALKKALKKAGVSKSAWPNIDWWQKHFYVPLEIWRTVLGNDKRSRVARVIRDGLQSRMVSFDFNFDKALHEVKCKPFAGMDRDFFGSKMPAKNLQPGPFQKLNTGHNCIMLWPVRGIETSWVLE